MKMSQKQTIRTGDNNTEKVEVPDPEVVPRAKRRRFTAGYKLSVVEEADRCSEPGEVGALLRREGLYSSHLSNWRRQRAEGQLRALAERKRGRKSQEQQVHELDELRREKEQLQVRLQQAELIIEVQKKLSQLLGLSTLKMESTGSE
jgi:transposase-like protein